MELLILAGLFFLFGGVALMVLSVVFGGVWLAVTWLVAGLILGVQALYRGITR